jgi:hypothetical protein
MKLKEERSKNEKQKFVFSKQGKKMKKPLSQ